MLQDFADRALAALSAFLIVLINELRLFNARPDAPTPVFSHPTLMQVLGDAETLYLSSADLWMRGVLAALAVTFAAWVLLRAGKQAAPDRAR